MVGDQVDRLAEANDSNPGSNWKQVISILREDPEMWITSQEEFNEGRGIDIEFDEDEEQLPWTY